MNIKDKKVLVTGAEGFIGSHLTERLIALGAKVIALAQYNSFNSWGWLDSLPANIKKEIQVITGDIREYDNIKNMIRGQEVVFHLAALIAIPYSYQSPLAYLRTNVEGTLNVLQACLDFGIERVIHTSTSEVYGTAQYVPIDEQHPLQGQSPYSASKIAADKIAESFYKSFNLPVATIRPFNTYGPRQSARAVIPTIIMQILSKKQTIRLGALSPTRDFNYVKDTVEGFIKVAECDAAVGDVINIGTNSEIAIGVLVYKIKSLMNSDIQVVCDENRLRPEKSEVERLWCDNTKARKMLGYQPRYTLEAGLTETIQWLTDHHHLYKSDIYNL